jgi:hypothetical protein
MKSVIAIAVLGLLLVSATEAGKRKSEYKPSATKTERIISPLPSDYIQDAALPDAWDWRVRLIFAHVAQDIIFFNGR